VWDTVTKNLSQTIAGKDRGDHVMGCHWQRMADECGFNRTMILPADRDGRGKGSAGTAGASWVGPNYAGRGPPAGRRSGFCGSQVLVQGEINNGRESLAERTFPVAVLSEAGMPAAREVGKEPP